MSPQVNTMFKFYGSGISYVSNRFKRLLDDNFSEVVQVNQALETRVSDLEAAATSVDARLLDVEATDELQAQGFWWTVANEVPTALVGQPNSTLMQGNLQVSQLVNPVLLSLTTDTLVPLPLNTGQRRYEMESHLYIDGKKNDILRITPQLFDSSLGQFVPLMSVETVCDRDPIGQQAQAHCTLYTATQGQAGDAIALFVENLTADRDITLKLGSTMKVRPV